MPHDQLFKELLHAFFREFIELFFPQVAVRLDLSEVTFLDRELFTDLPEGSRREADLVAQVNTLDGQPELILVHLEVQAKRERNVPYRMFEYYALLRLRYKLPVFPVVLYLAPGAGGLTREIYTETLFGQDILNFHYAVIGLPDLSADDYRESDSPLAALSALMRPSHLGRGRQKYLSLRHVLISSVDDARKMLLTNLIMTYLKLNSAEEAEFNSLVEQEQAEEVVVMLSVYEERGILIGKRGMLLNLMHAKFGDLPASVIEQINRIETEADLDRLSTLILTARSLAEMGFVED